MCTGANCTECPGSSVTCIECSSGYYLTGSATCEACTNDCLEC